MKIVHLTSFYRPEIGGIAEHVYNLNRFLRRKGLQSNVLHVVENSEESRLIQLSESEYRLHVKGNLEDHRKILRAGEIRRTIESVFGDVDLFHVHTFNRLEFITWRWRKWVWTAHLSQLPQMAESKRPKDMLLRFLFRMVFRDARKLIAVSRHQVPIIEKLTGRKDTIIVPSGIDLERFQGNHRPLIDRSPGRTVVLCPSLWRRVKGIDILLSAMEYIEKTFPQKFDNLLFVLLKSDREPHYAKEIQERLKNLKNYLLLDPVEPERMPALYASADIVVVPSRYESLGISILEAMAMGKPVIASRVGGIPDLIEDGQDGLLIPPEDYVSLAEAIMNLADNPDRRKEIGENARRKAMQFSWDRVAERLIKVYESSL